MKIAIAGASGFIGTHLIQALQLKNPTPQIIGLSRSDKSMGTVEWRKTDLFSLPSTIQSLKGADVGIYLVHSMLPSASHFQGSFSDTDLLLADNFARACLVNGVKKIIYVSGLVPEGHVSQHLQSRKEVEDIFHETKIPTTILRAGMVVGPGGSSFRILENLTKNLPFMVLPAWTKRTTQAIFIDDLVNVIERALTEEAFTNQTFNIVNGEKLVYENLLRQMAAGLGKKRLMVPIPINSTQFSKLWVTIFGESSYELVSPLVDSLTCDLPQPEVPALVQSTIRYKTFREMLTETLKREAALKIKKDSEKPKAIDQKLSEKNKSFDEKKVNRICSIQRLTSLPTQQCRWIALEYIRWLPSFVPVLLRIRMEPENKLIHLALPLLKRPLLSLKYSPEIFDENMQQFEVVGGLLARREQTHTPSPILNSIHPATEPRASYLEFRQISAKKFTLAAIHEFAPSLPWWIYLLSQAPIHRFTMVVFSSHLRRMKERKLLPLVNSAKPV